MGPLIPQDIINGDLNFFFALIIGIAFGFILEQAGFSSSRKLAGVFYGYDFVVLKVFFTAGVTAAIGLFFLKYMGWVDFNFLYVNPLYVWSALIGGIVMGFGFILGGFCPGTSLGAAVIGKIDAWFFIGGMFLGVFLFGIFYTVFEPLHMGHFLGSPFIYDTLGLSQKWFLVLLIFMALAAFAVTQLIEDNSTKFKDLLHTQKLSVRYPLLFAFILSIIILFLPGQRHSYSNEITRKDLAAAILSTERYIPVEKVAHTLVHDVRDLHLVDVRSASNFNTFHLPGAVNLPVETILDKSSEEQLTKPEKTTVLYANSSDKADMAWFFVSREGFRNIYVMEGGLNQMYENIFGSYDTLAADIKMMSPEDRFIQNAKQWFREGKAQKAEKASMPVPASAPAKAVKGGC